jgi:hypothetical protein
VLISLVALFSFNLIRLGQKIWITRFVVGDLLLLIASLAGLVSSYLWLRGRDGWSRWGVVSLLGLAIGFSILSLNIVRTEGLFAPTLSPHFDWIGICEQAGFLCWAGFAASFFWWNRPIARRLGLILSLAFLALMALCITIWVFNVSWTVPTSSPYRLSIQEMMRPAARATLYMFYLFIVMVLLRGASILSRDNREDLSSWILYLGSLAPTMFLIWWLSLQWFEPLIQGFYDLGGWISWIPASVCAVSIFASIRLHDMDGRRLKLVSVAFVASWLSILQLAVFVMMDPEPSPYHILFRGWISPKGTYGIYTIFLLILCFNSVIASRLIVRNLRKLSAVYRGKPPVGTVLNGYAIGFPLVLSAFVLISAPLIIFEDLLGLSSSIARFIFLGTVLPALVYLVGCLVAWRNLGTILGTPKTEPAT